MTTSRAALCSLLFLNLGGCSRPAGSVRLAVGGQSALRFFPVYLARELGLFAQQGVQVEIADLSGSVKAMQALMGGSADVAAGFYDQTIQMAGEGRRVRSFVVFSFTANAFLRTMARSLVGTALLVAFAETVYAWHVAPQLAWGMSVSGGSAEPCLGL